MPRPIIGVSACRRTVNGWTAHAVGEKYIKAVTDVVGGIPLILPPVGSGETDAELDSVIDALDGVLLTGSPSNVDPAIYGGPAARHGVGADRARDDTTLPLIRRAIERGVPLFAICRGIQELNVAFGGTLHQHVDEVPGRRDHRAPRIAELEPKYGPAHAIHIVPGTWLRRVWGADTADVNSLHGQGIDRPGDRLVVEATADDGTIEAVSVAGASNFAFGVQWHPEHRARENPLSMKLFDAFAEACRAHRAARRAPPLRAAAE
ncbi:MAG: gamma-glutamyl-gamma-aminobutyrate hydrolase family protein [Rhodospirillales bacterium]|nr:MAG: gamma-glutamyl-gamma-aminobutyrate hydrolase family protein [Rhodospirillales bacterium]